jgi:hypothetical protein
MKDRLRIAIASPCRARWSAMAGDDKKRFCGECKKHVHNLSAMSRAEVDALLGASGADGHPPCVRFFQRSDGTVLTGDCPVGVRLAAAARRRVSAIVTAGLALLLNGFGAGKARGMGALMGAPPPQPQQQEELQGKIAPPQPTPPAPTPVPGKPEKKK